MFSGAILQQSPILYLPRRALLGRVESLTMRIAFIIVVTTLTAFCHSVAFGQSSTNSKTQSPFEGVWLTKNGDSHVKISQCEKTLCNEIIWLKEPNDKKGKPQTDKLNQNPKERGRPIIGIPILLNMHQVSKTMWKGRLYKPRDGKSYKGHVRVINAKKLEVKGCHAVFPICKTQIWKKVRDLETN